MSQSEHNTHSINMWKKRAQDSMSSIRWSLLVSASAKTYILIGIERELIPDQNRATNSQALSCLPQSGRLTKTGFFSLAGVGPHDVCDRLSKLDRVLSPSPAGRP